jgi:tetratricopeptide (TPR) repeat protein
VVSEDNPNRPENPEKAIHDLEENLNAFKSLVDRYFTETEALFAPLITFQKSSATEALYTSLLDRQAHILARLGYRRQARRLWNRLTLEDRLNTMALKNVAVCDTFENDVSRTLTSWRAYVEALYFIAIARGNPAHGAQERADFHHQFAGAFAPLAFSQPAEAKQIPEVDPISLTGFLKSPSQVRLFVTHKLFAFLNAKLQMTSPPLILGTQRSDDEISRKKALNGLLNFVEETHDLLPDRISKAFAAIVGKYLEKTFETCKSAKRLTLENDPRYNDEEDLHKQWIKDICYLKITLYKVLMEHIDILVGLSSVDFFSELVRLDQIPIDQQETFLKNVGGSMGISDSEKLQNLMHFLQRQVAMEILNKSKKRKDPTQYLRFLNRLVRQNGREPDLPQALMNLTLQIAQQNQSAQGHEELAVAVEGWIERAKTSHEAKRIPEKKRITEIKSSLDDAVLQMFLIPHGGLGEDPDWEQKLPHLDEFIGIYPKNGSGHFMHMIACNHIAIKKTNAGESRTAQEYFDRASASAENVLEYNQHEQQRQQADNLLGGSDTFRQSVGIAAANQGDFDAALNQLLPVLEGDSATPDLVGRVMNIYLDEAKAKKIDMRHAEMNTVISEWIDRARKPGSASDKNDIDKIENMLDECTTKIFLAPIGEIDEDSDWEKVITAMHKAYTKYPDSISCHYYLMVAHYRLANQQAEAGKRSQAQRSLSKAGKEASLVIDQSKNEVHRKQAEGIFKQIEQVLGANL